jgi:hypothetical protein
MPRAADLTYEAGTDDEKQRRKMLLEAFESLGDNCEFGLVQRYFGAEPLGLLRWASIGSYELAEALSSRFAGVGDADITTLICSGSNEYVTRDQKYRMTMHTFIKCDSVSSETLHPQLMRRLAFLGRKLIEDLSNGEKIFVFKSIRGISDAEIALIAKALQQYGKNRLLCVREAGERHSPGSVAVAAPGVCVGYITKFGHHGGSWNIDFDSWLSVCAESARVFEQSQDGRAGQACSVDATTASQELPPTRQLFAASNHP